MKTLLDTHRTRIHSLTVPDLMHAPIESAADCSYWAVSQVRPWSDSGLPKGEPRARTFFSQRGWILHPVRYTSRTPPLPFQGCLHAIGPVAVELTYARRPTPKAPEACVHWIEIRYAGNDPDQPDHLRHSIVCGTRALEHAWIVFESLTQSIVPVHARHELARAAGYWSGRQRAQLCIHCGKHPFRAEPAQLAGPENAPVLNSSSTR